MATEAGANVMVIAGMFETRTVRCIKQRADASDEDDLIGYVSLDGLRTPVKTGYWGGAAIWQLDRDSEQWPVHICGAPLDIGSAGYWRCQVCNHALRALLTH
jgi:hypothetical protein